MSYVNNYTAGTAFALGQAGCSTNRNHKYKINYERNEQSRSSHSGLRLPERNQTRRRRPGTAHGCRPGACRRDGCCRSQSEQAQSQTLIGLLQATPGVAVAFRGTGVRRGHTALVPFSQSHIYGCQAGLNFSP